MRISGTSTAPLSALPAAHMLALGAVLATVGGTIIVLSQFLGWTEFARPWSFLIGLAAGMTGGIGIPLATCGLVRMSRGR